jgi:hypothetical protein
MTQLARSIKNPIDGQAGFETPLMRSIEAGLEPLRTPRALTHRELPVHPESLSKRGKSSEVALVKRYISSTKNQLQPRKPVKHVSPIALPDTSDGPHSLRRVTEHLGRQLDDELYRHSGSKLPNLQSLTLSSKFRTSRAPTPQNMDASMAEIQTTDMCLRGVEERQRESRKRSSIKKAVGGNFPVV